MVPPLFVAALLVAVDGPAKKPVTLESLAPNAAGIALVEVVAAKPFDNTPMDGHKGVEFQFKIVRSSGKVHRTVLVITAFGGAMAPGVKPKFPWPVKADSLKVGKRYWFAFSSDDDDRKHPQYVIAFWPEFTKGVANLLDKAVTANRYRWQPQFDPKTKLAHEHLVDEETNRWRIRVRKEGKVLWEKPLPWIKHYHLTWRSETGCQLPSPLPPCGKFLIAGSARSLKTGNEYGLPAKTYNVATSFDPETGRRLAVLVSRFQTGFAPELEVVYDPKTGRKSLGARYEWLQSGGRRVGAKKDAWWRKTITHFDPKTGREIARDVFRYDESRTSGTRWVKIRTESR